MKYLHSSYQCPVCDVEVHKTRPLLNIRYAIIYNTGTRMSKGNAVTLQIHGLFASTAKRLRYPHEKNDSLRLKSLLSIP